MFLNLNKRAEKLICTLGLHLIIYLIYVLAIRYCTINSVKIELIILLLISTRIKSPQAISQQLTNDKIPKGGSMMIGFSFLGLII